MITVMKRTRMRMFESVIFFVLQSITLEAKECQSMKRKVDHLWERHFWCHTKRFNYDLRQGLKRLYEIGNLRFFLTLSSSEYSYFMRLVNKVEFGVTSFKKSIKKGKNSFIKLSATILWVIKITTSGHWRGDLCICRLVKTTPHFAAHHLTTQWAVTFISSSPVFIKRISIKFNTFVTHH